MKINGEAIQQFFTQTIPQAGKAVKSRLLEVWNAAVQTRTQKSSDRKIHADVLQRDNWKVEGVAEKYSAPIKLLSERVRNLGAATGEERVKNMLSTSEVCLLLCCWQFFHENGYELDKCPQAVRELLEALIAGGLLQEKRPGEGYAPWLPHDQIGGLTGVTTYIEDLQKDPSREQTVNRFTGQEARFAIPSYLLDVLSPVVLIPRSSQPPLKVHEEDVKLLEALTPTHPQDFKDKRDIPIILNGLATLVSDSSRRDQFLKWWDASPLQPVIYGEGQVSAQAAFFARTDGNNNHTYSGIHDVINYIRSIDSPEAKPRVQNQCVEFIKNKLKEPLSEQTLANMGVSEAGRTWFQGLEKPLTAEPIRLDDTQYKMYVSLLRLNKDFIFDKELQELLQWVRDPVSFEQLKAVSKIKSDDLVLFPGEETPKIRRDSPYGPRLLDILTNGNILVNLEEAYTNRFDPKMSEDLLDLFSSLREAYGSAAIEKYGGRLAELMKDVDQFIRPLNPKEIQELDLKLCKTAVEQWDARDSWTAEEIHARYTAMSNLGNWLRINADKTFPDALIRIYPKLDELQKLPGNVVSIAKACASLANTSYSVTQLNRLDSKHPFQTISDKIAALTTTLPRRTRKEDRLTIAEFYLLKDVLKDAMLGGKVPYWITEEAFNQWRAFGEMHLLTPRESIVLVTFLNSARTQKIEENKESLIKRIQFLVSDKILGGHTEMTVKNLNGNVSAVGMRMDGWFKQSLSDFINPKFDSFELDLDRLACGIPEEKRDAFKDVFQRNLLKVTEKKGLRLPTKQNRIDRYKKLLQIQPRLEPSKAGFTKDDTTSFCSEFVMRSIMEATVLSFQELGVTPPETARYFGLSPRANLLLLSPAGLKRCLKRQGLLKPLNNIEQIIRF